MSGKALLQIQLSGYYRNLGREIEPMMTQILKKYPSGISGEFHIYSTDGSIYFAAYTIRDGKLYRRELSKTLEEIK